MPSYPLPAIRVDPAGQTVGVNITSPAGATITAYTDPLGANAATLPTTISTPTVYYLPPGPYKVLANDYSYNVVVEGSQVATVSAATAPQIGTPNTADVPVTIAASGAACTLDLSLGTLFYVTLTAPTVTISLANVGQLRGDTINIVLQQDNSGGRYVVWPTTFLFPGGIVPALSQKANAIDRVRAVTPNGGASFTADGGVSSAFAGVDPLTIPGITDVLEAWTQPYHQGETIATPYGAKGGTWAAIGTVTMGEGWRYSRGSGIGAVQPLDRFGDRRWFFDCTTAASGLSLTRSIYGSPFTIIMACELPTNTNNASFIESTAGAVPQLYYNTTDLFSMHDTTLQFINWVQTSPPAAQAFGWGAPVVIAFYGDGTSGANGFKLRLNGVNCTPASGTQQSTGGAATSLIFSQGTNPFVDGKLKISAIYVAAATMLDFSTAASPGVLLERYAAAPLGLII